MNSTNCLLAFSLGPMEIGLLLLVMIFVFGPRRIPEIGQSLGQALSGFRKATKDGDKDQDPDTAG